MLTRLRTHGLMPLVTRVAAEQGVTIQALPGNPVAVLALGRALMRRGWSGWSAGNLLGLPAGWDAPTNLPMPAPVDQTAEPSSMAARWAAARKGTPAPVEAPLAPVQVVALPVPLPPPVLATPKPPTEAAPLPLPPNPVPAPIAPPPSPAPVIPSTPAPPAPVAASTSRLPMPAEPPPAPVTRPAPAVQRSAPAVSLARQALFGAPRRGKGRPRKVKTLPALLPPRPSKEELALDDLEIDAEIDPDAAEELEAVEEAPASPWDPDDPDAAPPGPEEPVVNDQAARLRLMERRRDAAERVRLREGFYADLPSDTGDEDADDPDDLDDEAEAADDDIDVAPGGGRGRRTDRITKTELLLGRSLYPVEDHGRPKTRGECASVPRPCPFVSCKYSLYLDVEIDRIIIVFPDREPDEMRPSCALDVADLGPATLEVVGKVTNVTRERIRQVEGRAFRKIKNSKRRLRLLEAIDDE